MNTTVLAAIEKVEEQMDGEYRREVDHIVNLVNRTR